MKYGTEVYKLWRTFTAEYKPLGNIIYFLLPKKERKRKIYILNLLETMPCVFHKVEADFAKAII